jgi:type IV pilus assembly protein PilA
MIKNTKKGFTLIELLVVIAIIGILASVVLASLSTARNKAKDASAKASMSAMRAQAEIGVNDSGSYILNICTATASGGLADLISAVDAQVGTPVCGQDTVTGTRPGAWGVQVELTTTGDYYCVDSTGYAGPSTSAGDIASGFSSADVVCDNS